MDDDNFATVLESFVATSSLWVAKVHAKKVSGLDHLVFAKRWGISPKKALNTIHHTVQCEVHTVVHLSLSQQFRINHHQYCTVHCHRICSVKHFLSQQYQGETSGVHRYLPLTLVSHVCSQWSWKVKPRRHCPFFFNGTGCHQQWYVTMLKKWSLASFIANSRRHHVIWSRQSHSPHGQI